ncbi:plasmid SOS inhibition protein A, partial [Escherichia coli]|uniref:plasmid SOS inhibition protein A n=1 Tax=Escherichia coli TaxID=562 RepID=UPI0038FC73C2
MSARSQALVPLSTEQQAAWRAVAETEKRRHQGNTLAEYPYAGAFFRCLNGSRRISLSDLRFFMPSLTAEELHGNRLQWLYAIDVLIETQGEVCLLPLPGDAAEGTVAKLAMRQPFVLFKGLTFQKLCLPGAFRPGDHHNKML